MRSVVVRPRFWIPLVIFLVVAGFFLAGLRLDSSLVPSALIGKQAPAFELPRLNSDDDSFNPERMLGQPWVLNVWASWCVACRDEHQLLVDLATLGIPIVGLNYKDELKDARRWLRDWGNPYVATAVDYEGNAAIDWGVYGVPETFVIDSSGVIVYKHIGPITNQTAREEILPLFQEPAG